MIFTCTVWRLGLVGERQLAQHTVRSRSARQCAGDLTPGPRKGVTTLVGSILDPCTSLGYRHEDSSRRAASEIKDVQTPNQKGNACFLSKTINSSSAKRSTLLHKHKQTVEAELKSFLHRQSQTGETKEQTRFGRAEAIVLFERHSV
jgi:hypothetical protein